MMKIIGFVLLFLLMSNYSLALSATQQTTFTVTINSVFELSIDQGLIDFGKMNPGETKHNMPSSGILVLSKTNNGNPWFLKIDSSSPFASGNNLIQAANFKWSGWTDGAGTWFGMGSNIIRSTPTIAYASAAGEENNLPNGTTNHFKFNLAVPSSQAPGIYTTTVKFTMTE